MTCLLLNVTGEPITILPLNRAVVLVLQEKAEILEDDGGFMRSAHTTLPRPAVIRLRYFVRIPFRSRVALSNRNVLTRDDYTCAYCGKRANTIDHVDPRAKYGLHRWENVVAACKRCNAQKGAKTLKEMGWTLPYTPHAPIGVHWIVLGIKTREEWIPYLTLPDG